MNKEQLDRMKRLRELAGISIGDIGKYLDMTPSHYKKIEDGTLKTFDREFFDICNYFNDLNPKKRSFIKKEVFDRKFNEMITALDDAKNRMILDYSVVGDNIILFGEVFYSKYWLLSYVSKYSEAKDFIYKKCIIQHEMDVDNIIDEDIVVLANHEEMICKDGKLVHNGKEYPRIFLYLCRAIIKREINKNLGVKQ